MAKVINFSTRDGIVGDGAFIDPDQILENNKGLFKNLVLVGEDQDGNFTIACSRGNAEAFLMLNVGADMILNGFRP